LSVSHRARFFRKLAAAFPELLDVICSTDARLADQIAKLQRSISFMCACIAETESNGRNKIHNLIHGWQLGPVMDLLIVGKGNNFLTSGSASLVSEDSAARYLGDRLVLGELLHKLSGNATALNRREAGIEAKRRDLIMMEQLIRPAVAFRARAMLYQEGAAAQQRDVPAAEAQAIGPRQ
jgi:hypothetical protein